jgi:hypothetical protein
VNQREEIKRLRRASLRSERFPKDAACENCGERDPRALVPGQVLCYGCSGRRRGRVQTEQHHIGGRHNSDVTLAVPANEHRILSDMQANWPEETMKNPDKNPLVAIEAHLRGWIDLVKVAIERVFSAVLAPLVALNSDLCSAHGRQWWNEPEFATFRASVPVWMLA